MWMALDAMIACRAKHSATGMTMNAGGINWMVSTFHRNNFSQCNRWNDFESVPHLPSGVRFEFFLLIGRRIERSGSWRSMSHLRARLDDRGLRRFAAKKD